MRVERSWYRHHYFWQVGRLSINAIWVRPGGFKWFRNTAASDALNDWYEAELGPLSLYVFVDNQGRL